jgi:hypothetical protein
MALTGPCLATEVVPSDDGAVKGGMRLYMQPAEYRGALGKARCNHESRIGNQVPGQLSHLQRGKTSGGGKWRGKAALLGLSRRCGGTAITARMVGKCTVQKRTVAGW